MPHYCWASQASQMIQKALCPRMLLCAPKGAQAPAACLKVLCGTHGPLGPDRKTGDPCWSSKPARSSHNLRGPGVTARSLPCGNWDRGEGSGILEMHLVQEQSKRSLNKCLGMKVGGKPPGPQDPPGGMAAPWGSDLSKGSQGKEEMLSDCRGEGAGA